MHNLHRNSSLAFIRLHTSQALTNGRLGNQMSAFALVYSLGSKHGLRPLMWSETRKHFDEVFEDSSDGRRVLLRRFVFARLETFSIVDLDDEELERRPRELKELDASVVQGFRSLLGRTPTSFPAQGSVRATSRANPRRNIRQKRSSGSHRSSRPPNGLSPSRQRVRQRSPRHRQIFRKSDALLRQKVLKSRVRCRE